MSDSRTWQLSKSGKAAAKPPKVNTADDVIDHVIERYDEALRKLEKY